MDFIEHAHFQSSWCALAFLEAEWLAISADPHTDYWHRRGLEWIKSSCDNYGKHLLCEGVSAWLYENVGHSFLDYWSVDRIHYSDANLPPLKDQVWEDTYEVVPLARRNWRCQPEQQRILFRQKDHAALFKLAFHGIE